MKNSLRILVVILCFLLAWFRPALSEARVYLDITSAQLRKVPVAVPYFEESSKVGTVSETGKKMSELLGRALAFHGFIEIMAPEKYMKVPEADWKTLGLDFSIMGKYTQTASGMVMELRLYDVREGRMILGRRYRGVRDKWRVMVLKFCDEVVMKLTGEPGVSLSRIAFVSEASGFKEIYVSDVLGDEIRQVTSHGSLALSPRFSPDGSQLVYTSYHRGNPNLYITDLSQSKVTRPLSKRQGLNMAPAWSPDGKKMAVTLSVDGNPDLYLMDMKGNIVERLTKEAGINVSPSWSPDGRQLVFISDRTGAPQLYLMELGNRAVRRLTYQGSYNTSPSWSPKGDLIAYTGRYEGNYHIFTISPDGKQLKRLTNSWGDYESPSWSPDGRQVVFSRYRSDKKQICSVFENGAGVRALFHFSGNQTLPQWSPRLEM